MEYLALDSDSDFLMESYSSLDLNGLGKGFSECPRVLSVLSSVLEGTVLKNAIALDVTKKQKRLTIFDGLRPPSLCIRQYLERIFEYSSCSPSCFILAYIYMDRFIHQQPEVPLTSLNVHRLLITSVMVAAKFIDDAFFDNAYYAKVGGVSTTEINRLELELLFTLDFRLQVSIVAFQTCCAHLEKEAGGYQIERPPVKLCKLRGVAARKKEDPNDHALVRINRCNAV
ncbi:hypothetical protein AMTRI_Chr01g135840 [Amborella trichopoda]|uniref:Cyclin n=1 Tax=Amborella trichopoda TaxID=13333 RepID=W1PWX9_AMBTC|nr:cyclin-U4-1 [Amborella trichopoda]XP_020526989.1 cyclin-U4-1 [Amborella trichopoda]ERN12673.1 hypothetical protein AMTR_s00025p00245040 [Amborella trichopoda]|eukprot:XP_006851092.1 cyclin-U4-1 [Amborella trichopoda]